MHGKPPPLPPGYRPFGPIDLKEACKRVRNLAFACQHAEPDMVRAIAAQVNEIILTAKIPPNLIQEALIGTSMRTKALTGYTVTKDGKRIYSEDDIFEAIQRHPKYMVDAMKQYPGKKSAIDLCKLTAAVNSSKFPTPPKTW